MITPDTGRVVQTQGVAARGMFGIREEDHAHLMSVLRDTLYSDKVLAVLREYGSNAWDAHKEVGKGDVPIQVTLPTHLDLTLRIRDFGPGLSDDDVFNVYAMYGASTKRNTNEQVGSLGLGAKSMFCYSDSFTITSWHGGYKRIYVAVLDASEVGEIQRLSEEPCDPEETGIEIQAPVRPKDILEFQEKASWLFRFFEPQPLINIELPKVDRHITEHGYIVEGRPLGYGTWIAHMGCVPYRMDIAQVDKELSDLGLADVSSRLRGGLYFKIGEVQISASREDLKYSDLTKQAIVKRFGEMIDAYVNDVLSSLEKSGLTPWERRLKGTLMAHTLKIPIPAQYAEWAKPNVPLFGEKAVNPEPPETFTLSRPHHGVVERIPVDQHTRLVIKDDDRDIAGFSLRAGVVLVVPVKDADLANVRAELDAYVEDAQLTGISIDNLSVCPWSLPYRSGRKKKESKERAANVKHRVRVFQLRDAVAYSSPWSSAWEVVSREPQDDDVFVVLSHFQAERIQNFYRMAEDDRALARMYDTTLPPIYGYKSTQKKPVEEAAIKGTHYLKWRRQFFEKLMEKDRQLREHREWVRAIGDHFSYASVTVPKALAALDAEHPVRHLFQRYSAAYAASRQMNNFQHRRLDLVLQIVHPTEKLTDAESTLAAVFGRYKLLGVTTEGLNGFEANPEPWIDYVQMVDARRKEEDVSVHADE